MKQRAGRRISPTPNRPLPPFRPPHHTSSTPCPDPPVCCPHTTTAPAMCSPYTPPHNAPTSRYRLPAMSATCPLRAVPASLRYPPTIPSGQRRTPCPPPRRPFAAGIGEPLVSVHCHRSSAPADTYWFSIPQNLFQHIRPISEIQFEGSFHYLPCYHFSIIPVISSIHSAALPRHVGQARPEP